MITFDGLPASGKTTQARLLCDRFGWTVFHYSSKELESSFDGYISKLMRLNNVSRRPNDFVRNMLYCMYLIRIHYDFGWLVDDVFVIEYFMNFLIYFYGDKDFDNIINFFVNGLNLYGGREPTISFYLYVPYDILMDRFFNRDGVDNAYIDYLHCFDAVKHIESCIPYFHVIDGEQSVDKIHSEIVSILSDKGLVYDG